MSTFSFYGLRFDSTSIIYPDSSLSHTGFSYSSIGWGDLGNINQGLLLDTESSIGVFQVTLGGIFRPMTLTPPSVVSNSNRPSTIPIQTFPNPFSQSTTITFSSPESGMAEITIVNLLGSEVARVFSGELEAGEHSFEWSNTSGVPDGVYQCLLRMNGRVETLPIVLLK